MSITGGIAVLEGGFWVMKKAYDLGYWAIYGTPKTKEEVIKEEIDDIKHNIAEINRNTRRNAEEDAKHEKQKNLLSPSMFIAAPEGVYPSATA